LAKNRETLRLTSDSDGRARHRNRSGLVDLVGREPLMFAKVENGVTKSCQNFRRKNRKNAILAAWFFHFFEQDRLLFARVDIGVTEFQTKTAEKEEEEKWGLRFFFN